jgi:hypothetical protein
MALDNSGIRIFGSAVINGRHWTFDGMQSRKRLQEFVQMDMRSIVAVPGRPGFHYRVELDGIIRSVTFCGKNATERMASFLHGYM